MHCIGLLAGKLAQVLEICSEAGWSVEVEYTAPPRNEPTGQYRVIRCLKLDDNRLLLTAAREVPGKLEEPKVIK